MTADEKYYRQLVADLRYQLATLEHRIATQEREMYALREEARQCQTTPPPKRRQRPKPSKQ